MPVTRMSIGVIEGYWNLQLKGTAHRGRTSTMTPVGRRQPLGLYSRVEECSTKSPATRRSWRSMVMPTDSRLFVGPMLKNRFEGGECRRRDDGRRWSHCFVFRVANVSCSSWPPSSPHVHLALGTKGSSRRAQPPGVDLTVGRC